MSRKGNPNPLHVSMRLIEKTRESSIRVNSDGPKVDCTRHKDEPNNLLHCDLPLL